jgi:hypothetical protein
MSLLFLCGNNASVNTHLILQYSFFNQCFFNFKYEKIITLMSNNMFSYILDHLNLEHLKSILFHLTLDSLDLLSNLYAYLLRQIYVKSAEL